MRKTMAQKIICIVVASLFLINNIAYGLSPMPGSRQPGTQDAMLALGVKLLAAKNGPGAIDFDSYRPRSFVGDELLSHTDVGAYIEEANGYKTKFVKADYDNPPEAWENNPILIKETDLIRALKGFSATEAKISAENLDIREGYFLVDEEKGELPVARIEKVGENKYVLIVHTKFVQLWNHIRKNDVWFEANLGPNDRRTISVAWGIFYRLAKHELTDLKHENLLPKSIGHIRSINGEVILNKDEIAANTIGGNYRLLNDAIWMWFLGAYCFSNATRYNNETFLQRINWMFDDKGAAELGIDSELPQLFSDRENRTLATAFAYAINYRFFNRPGIVVPKTSVDEKFIRESEEREKARKAIGITEKPIYATGQAPAPDKKVTIENLSVDTLTEAVTTEIRSDFATKTREKEKVVKLWNNFIEERATIGMTVNIADVKKAIAAKIKMDKIDRDVGRVLGLASIGAGIVFVIRYPDFWPTSVFLGVVGFAIIVASRWAIDREKRFATLAGYLEKAENGLASQTVSTVKEEQISAVTEVASEEKTPESRASSTSEEAVPTTRPIVEEHPFVKLISEYIVRLGLEKGPGIEALSTVELENLYKTVNLLSEVHVELFIPQQVKLTENMQTAIKDMGKKEGGSYIICRQYSDLQNLTKLLESPPAGKRIVITDIAEEKDQDEMARLVAKHPESFRVTRLLNIMLPVNYSNMDNIEKTVYQAKIVTIAILARLFEKNKTPMVEMLLRYMIKGCLDVDDKGMNEYFDELGNPNDGQGLSREALIKRILFLIGKTIKVVERIGEEIRLMKAFWTAA
ncbi:MAG: hypothetical protein A3G36_04390 [Omnitrophica bacterium RIFCSPLOWO2_12_FULL_45_13]|nr:MAG: hypothetical protein A3G36_04390 [Omnitrophica bacterium RIFCSPLOWO2_12_FULL_45_13]